jgi:hypothetical protein
MQTTFAGSLQAAACAREAAPRAARRCVAACAAGAGRAPARAGAHAALPPPPHASAAAALRAPPRRRARCAAPASASASASAPAKEYKTLCSAEIPVHLPRCARRGRLAAVALPPARTRARCVARRAPLPRAAPPRARSRTPLPPPAPHAHAHAHALPGAHLPHARA